MSVYVGIDVHRKRSQVAVIDQDGQVLANRNVNNGVTPILSVIGDLPPGTPAAFEAAFGWGWLLELLEAAGAPAGPRPGAAAQTGSDEEKPQPKSTPTPGPADGQVTGLIQHALLTTGALMGAVTDGLDGELARLQDRGAGGMAPLATPYTTAGLAALCPSRTSLGTDASRAPPWPGRA